VAAAGLAASSACGGRVDPGDDGGASSGSSTGSGSGSGTGGSGGGGNSGSSSGNVPVPPCPSEPPAAGSKCVAPGQQACAFFTGQHCSAFICNDSSVWQSAPEGC